MSTSGHGASGGIQCLDFCGERRNQMHWYNVWRHYTMSAQRLQDFMVLPEESGNFLDTAMLSLAPPVFY